MDVAVAVGTTAVSFVAASERSSGFLKKRLVARSAERSLVVVKGPVQLFSTPLSEKAWAPAQL